MSERTPTEVAQAMRRSMLADYHFTFTTEAGQRVLEDLRTSAYYYRTTAVYDTHGAIDPVASARNEGARALVLAIDKHLRDAVRGEADVPAYATSSTRE